MRAVRFAICSLVVTTMLLYAAVVRSKSATATLPRMPVKAAAPEIQLVIDQAETLAGNGNASKAISLLNEAEAKTKSAKDSLSQGAIALSLAASYKIVADEKQAKGALYRAVDAYRAAADFADLAIAFTELGILSEHGKAGAQLFDAIAEYRNAAEDFEKAGYYEEAGFARTKMGQMWQRRGRLLPAIEAYNKAIELTSKPDSLRRPNSYGRGETTGLAYAALANAYAAAGNYEFARYILDVNTLFFSVKDAPLTHAAAENEYAAVDIALANYQDAFRRAETGLEGARIVGDRRLEAQLLFHRGIAKAWLQLPGATDDFNAAAKIANDLGDNHLRAILLLKLARLTRDPGKARSILGDAIKRFNPYPDTEPFIEATALYAEMCARLGDLDEAASAFELAATRAEEVADDFPKLTDLRVNYYRQHQDIFNGLIDVYLRKNDLPNAYWWVQIKKARGILDASSLKSSNLLPQLSADEKLVLAGNQDDIARYGRQELAARLTGKENLMSHVWLGIREMELNAYVNFLYSKHTDIKPSFPMPLADLEYLPRVLPEDSALLEYASLDSGLSHRLVLLVATIEQGKLKLNSYTLKDQDGQTLSTEKCDQLARSYHTACTIPAAAVKAPSSKLYQLLIAQSEDQIKGKRRLIICPDGPLWQIPFQSLTDGNGSYLIQTYEVDYQYSASTFTASMNRKPHLQGEGEKKILVIADPSYGTRQRFFTAAREGPSTNGESGDSWIKPLAQTVAEAEMIKRVFPQTQILSEDKAQESEIRKQIANSYYIHFATHAVVFDDQPFMSALVLATPGEDEPEDGFLTAREMMDMVLRADMVVLSACNTGRGQRRGSEGIVGLGWALFIAGSPAQALTQWQVSDASTAKMMGYFYGSLRAGKAKGAALQEAARKMLDDPRTRHPYYWAPFFLIGDYR